MAYELSSEYHIPCYANDNAHTFGGSQDPERDGFDHSTSTSTSTDVDSGPGPRTTGSHDIDGASTATEHSA